MVETDKKVSNDSQIPDPLVGIPNPFDPYMTIRKLRKIINFHSRAQGAKAQINILRDMLEDGDDLKGDFINSPERIKFVVYQLDKYLLWLTSDITKDDNATKDKI